MVCRETRNIFYYLKIKRYRKVFNLIKNFDKVTYQDSFMPIVCKIFGHEKYLIKDYDSTDLFYYACKRCNRFIGKSSFTKKDLIKKDRIDKLKSLDS